MSDLGEMNRDVDDSSRDVLVGPDAVAGADALGGGEINGVELDEEDGVVGERRETVPVEVNEADWLDSAAEPAPDPDDYR